MRKVKWMIFAGYNCNKKNIDSYLNYLEYAIDDYSPKYENWLLIGDLNSEISESRMKEFYF